MTDLERLERLGDCVEKGILAKALAPLDGCLHPYATIWANHILPRRIPGTPSLVTPGWMPFAGSHYTAMIRTFHAWQSLEELVTLSGQEERFQDGAFLLDIHKASASFWWNQGAAIDTLASALTTYPDASVCEVGKDHLVEKVKFLDYVYDRRTQYIHSTLVPVKATSGGVIFHFHHLGNSKPNHEGVSKSTEWKSQYTPENLLNDFYPETWQKFLQAVTNAWWYLNTKLKEDDKEWKTLAANPPPLDQDSTRVSGETAQRGLLGGRVVSGFGFDDPAVQSGTKPPLSSRFKPPPPSDPPPFIPPSGMP